MLVIIIDGYLNIFIDELFIINLNRNFNHYLMFIIHVTFNFKNMGYYI